jgi:SAM-dependent methyltransferase
MNEKVDYADVIDATDYTLGLLEHPDIPQADAGIMRLIKRYKESNSERILDILDLGCGPGRLTRRAALEFSTANVVGLDISDGFIKSAKEKFSHNLVKYEISDFLEYDSSQLFDVIFMQGSFHHIELEKRQEWVDKIKKYLHQGGRIIIGDEYIPDYAEDSERVINVAGLYCYVIAYAVRNNHKSLAAIECMNLIDDVCHGKTGAGHSNSDLLAEIKSRATIVNQIAYTDGVKSVKYITQIQNLVNYINDQSEKLVDQSENNYRGDYKISIEKQIDIFKASGFEVETILKYGPTDWFGGMGVLSFKKV